MQYNVWTGRMVHSSCHFEIYSFGFYGIHLSAQINHVFLFGRLLCVCASVLAIKTTWKVWSAMLYNYHLHTCITLLMSSECFLCGFSPLQMALRERSEWDGTQSTLLNYLNNAFCRIVSVPLLVFAQKPRCRLLESTRRQRQQEPIAAAPLCNRACTNNYWTHATARGFLFKMCKHV